MCGQKGRDWDPQIELGLQENEDFDSFIASLGRKYPILGGSWREAAIAGGIPESEAVVAGGWRKSLDVLNALASGRLQVRFAEILFCEECINGPMMDNSLSMFERAGIIREFALIQSDLQKAQHDILSFKNILLRAPILILSDISI